MSDRPLDSSAIARYVDELADELEGKGQRTIVVVGGALLAWHGLRDATQDVDSLVALDAALVAAVERVAARHDLAPKWLNSAAAAYVPATFEPKDCQILLDRPSLRVLGAPWNQVFLMKLYASRAVDADDMEAIWPHCTFASPEAVVDLFYEAYPMEERDPHLADHIRDVVGGG